MKLLFDQNLSRTLVGTLKDIFPDSAHVSQFDMLEATDKEIWRFALAQGYAIVTKDGDYADLVAVDEGNSHHENRGVHLRQPVDHLAFDAQDEG